MGPNDKVRIGVVGCGRWGRHYIRLFSSLPHTQLAAVADQDTDRITDLSAQLPDLKVFNDHKALLNESICDAIVVATDASTHYTITKDALAAGVDVLAEKPLTLNVDEARALEALATDSGRILMVAHTFLFNPSIIQLKEYVSDGTLGDIYYLKSQRSHLGMIREDVNAVWDLAPHDISILLYLLGEMPCQVHALGRRVLKAGREDAAFIDLLFPSGIIAHVHVSWADSNKERLLSIVGSKARVVFDDLSVQEPIRIFHKGISVESEGDTSFGEFKYLLRDGDIVSPMIPVKEPLKVLCEDFATAVLSREQPFSDAAFGRNVVEVLSQIEECLESTRSNGGGNQ